MKDITPVVRAAKRLEALLEEKFGAQGRGLHEKLSSVERRVPAELHKTIRYVATVRNKAVHEDDYEIDDVPGLLHQAERVARELEQLQAGNFSTPVPGRRAAGGSSMGASVKRILGALGVFSLACCMPSMIFSRCGANTPPQTASSTPVANPTPRSGKDADGARAQTASSTPAAKKTRPSGKDGNKAEGSASPPAPGGLSDDVTARFARGEHVSLDSPLLKIEKISLEMVKEFSGLKPLIQLTVRNTSTKTLSGGVYEARLFIDSQPRPVIDQGSSSGTSEELYMSFGHQGLKAGESTTATLSSLSMRDWALPDIINARRRQLVIRNKRVIDGLENSIDVESAPFKVLPSTAPIYTAPTPSARPSKPGGPVDFAAAVHGGRSVGVGNQALSLQNVEVKMGRGSFDRPQPIITVDMTNVGERTLSDAVIQAQLYLDGQDKPVLKTSEELGGSFSDAPSALLALFGNQGLAPGQTRKVQLTPDSFSRIWTSPDVVNAKSYLILLRVVGSTDGLNKPYGGTAQRLP